MSEATLQLLVRIRQRLRTALRRRVLADVVFGLLVTVTILGVLLLVGAGVEALLWMGVGLRSLFFWTFILGAVGLLGYYVLRPLLQLVGILPGLNERLAAHQAGTVHPAVADRLTALLDLAEGRAGATSSPLLDHAMNRLGRDVEPIPFETIEDTVRVRRIAPWALLPLAGLVVFFLAAPTAFVGAVDRLFEPGVEFQPPAPFSFALEPGDVELARGEALTITARPLGTGYPPDALLEWGRTDEDALESVRLSLQDGQFAHVIPNVRADLRYRVAADGVVSPWYTATVVTRPVVRGLLVTLSPPRYTGLPARRLAPGVGDVVGLPGTQVRVSVTLGDAPLSEARLVLDWTGAPSQDVALTVDGNQAVGVFTLRQKGTYRIRLVGSDGRENVDPVAYPLATLRDSPPQITLLEGTESPLSAERRRARFRITDDFGFARAALYWRVAERRDGPPAEDYTGVPLPIQDGRSLDQQVLASWLPRAGSRALQAGDVIEFFGEVRDNDAVRGYKPARTPVYTLRYPSLDEQFDELGEAQDETLDNLDDLGEEEERFRNRFEELREELRRDPEPDWEDRRQLDQLMQQQEQMQQQAQSLSGQMEELLERMQEGDLVSEQTMQLYESMQQVMDELDSPELREALDMLRQAMEEMDMQQMMESLDEIAFDEEQFRERLERAMELLERLQTAQEMDEVAARAEDLARLEEQLREATERLEEREHGEDRSGSDSDSEGSAEEENGESSDSDSSDEESSNGESSDGERDPEAERERLAQEQERAQEAMEELLEQLQEVQERMQEQRGAPQEQMQQMMQETQPQDLPQQMEQNAQQLRENQLGPAQDGQQQMQQQLQQMSQQMQQMGQQMQGEQQQVNMQAIRRVLDDVLTLSTEQERLGDETGALPSRSASLRPLAQQQVELADGLATVSDTLSTLARQIPQMTWKIQSITSDALREMGQSTQRLADLQPGPASGHQKTAMTHLNDLALMLSELLDQMQNGGGGGGGMSMQQMQQQLQQMGEGQDGLGNQMQQMLNDMAGERLSQSAQQRAQQAAAQQEAIRQQLQQLIENGGGNLDAQTRSALQRAAEQMEQAARELRQGRVTRESVERQQQILQRLLEAERSVNQRGREERREGQTGEERPAPDGANRLDIPDTEGDRLRRDLIRALESGYAPDYQELIKRYFEQLQNQAQ